MSIGELHAREREDLALHVQLCAERYGAVQNGLGSLSAMPGFSPAQPVTVVQPLRSAGRNSRSPGMLSRMW